MSVDGPDFPADGRPTLGRYVLVREIARSNDVVWEALDPRMGRRLALKELALPPTLRGQPRRERVERFFREARAAGAMSHPGIVTVYEVGEEDGRYFIAMEFLEGHTLRERLAAAGGGPLPLPEAARVLCRLCEALAYAHARGVVHRDVKPDNVHLLPGPGGGPGGAVKLTDFGIARITHEDALTLDGQVFGTPSYMSPEQVVGKRIDARSDLFSLGVVLYEMLTGRKPFAGDSVVTITYRIVNDEIASLAGYPYALEAVLRRALAKDPADRFPTATDFQEAFVHAVRRAGLVLPDEALFTEAAPEPPTPAAGQAPLLPVPSEKTVAYRTEMLAPVEPPPPGVGPDVKATAAAAEPPASWIESAGETKPSVLVPAPSAPGSQVSPRGGRLRPSRAGISRAAAPLLGLALGGLLWFSPARRQPAPPAAPPPPPPSSLAEADVVAYQRALNQYAAGQFEQAARGFAHLGATSADIEVRSRANLRLLYCYRNLGRQASGRGDLAAAERWLRAAVKLAPENAQARWELHAVRKKIAGARATATASPGLLSAHGGPPDAKP